MLLQENENGDEFGLRELATELWTPNEALIVPTDPFERFLVEVQKIHRKNISDEQKRLQIQQYLDAIGQKEIVVPESHNWEEWLEEHKDDSYDWVIPFLLERGERVIVVAGEGIGKSMLARQVAICIAAGIHPFTNERIKPVRTTTVDLENPDKVIQRTSRRIMMVARERTREKEIVARLHLKPDGINLLSSAGRHYIETIVERDEPEVLFMGPLYKSFIDAGGRSAEATAAEIAMYYDYLRFKYGCALWLEQHAPLGNGVNGRELRPFGSAVWSRWPEFGVTIAKDELDPFSYKFGFFRGSRDQRKWPETAHRGGPHDFPFVVDSFIS